MGHTTLTRLLDQGLPVTEIATRTGYSTTGVYKILRREGLTGRIRRASSQADNPEVLDRLRRLYDGEHHSIEQIARCEDRGPGWVKARLLAAGVPLRSAGQQRRLSGVDPSRVRHLLDGQYSVADIAKITCRAESTIREVIRGQGWTTPPRRKGAPRREPLDAERLRELYLEQRLTLAETAREMRCSIDYVRSALIAAGIPRRHPGRRDDTRPAPLDADQIRELYLEQNLTAAATARQLKTTVARVNAALHRFGIPKHPPDRRAPGLDVDAETLYRLYVAEHLDDLQIGVRLGVPAWRVTRRRRDLGVARPLFPPPHPDRPAPPAADELMRMYKDEGMTLAGIARARHTSVHVVREWLTSAGVGIAERTSRAHRRQLDVDLIRQLYVEREWSAAEIATDQDVGIQIVLRTLHDNGVPVRRGGPRDRHRSNRLLSSLYGDPDVLALLKRHKVPAVPASGPIVERFPSPAPISENFLNEAYIEVGLSARHIELLTGQPAEQILLLLHQHQMPVRHRRGAASPWLLRQRSFG